MGRNGYQRNLNNRYEEVDSFEENERIAQNDVEQTQSSESQGNVDSQQDMDAENQDETSVDQNSDHTAENEQSEEETQMDLINLGDYHESEYSNEILGGPKDIPVEITDVVELTPIQNVEKRQTNVVEQESHSETSCVEELALVKQTEKIGVEEMTPIQNLKENQTDITEQEEIYAEINCIEELTPIPHVEYKEGDTEVTYADENLIKDLTKKIDDSIERLAKNIDDISEETQRLNKQRMEYEDKKAFEKANYEPKAPDSLMQDSDKNKLMTQDEQEEYYNEIIKKIRDSEKQIPEIPHEIYNEQFDLEKRELFGLEKRELFGSDSSKESEKAKSIPKKKKKSPKKKNKKDNKAGYLDLMFKKYSKIHDIDLSTERELTERLNEVEELIKKTSARNSIDKQKSRKMKDRLRWNSFHVAKVLPEFDQTENKIVGVNNNDSKAFVKPNIKKRQKSVTIIKSGSRTNHKFYINPIIEKTLQGKIKKVFENEPKSKLKIYDKFKTDNLKTNPDIPRNPQSSRTKVSKFTLVKVDGEDVYNIDKDQLLRSVEKNYYTGAINSKVTVTASGTQATTLTKESVIESLEKKYSSDTNQFKSPPMPDNKKIEDYIQDTLKNLKKDLLNGDSTKDIHEKVNFIERNKIVRTKTNKQLKNSGVDINEVDFTKKSKPTVKKIVTKEVHLKSGNSNKLKKYKDEPLHPVDLFNPNKSDVAKNNVKPKAPVTQRPSYTRAKVQTYLNSARFPTTKKNDQVVEIHNEMLLPQSSRPTAGSKRNNSKDQSLVESKILRDNFNIARTSLSPQPCKEYHENKALFFEGHKKFNKKNGNGSIYHENGTLKFHGNFKNDNIHGKDIKLYYNNNVCEFSGDIINGTRENYGKLYYPTGQLKYKGFFKNNKMHDQHATIYSLEGNLVFEGHLISGKKSGLCKIYNEDGSLRFKGNFKNNEMSQMNARIFSKYSCKGDKKLLNSSNIDSASPYLVKEYEGDVFGGKRQNYGREFDSEGRLLYEGYFLDDLYHGKINRLYNPKTGCQIYEGGYHNNKKSGFGTLYDKSLVKKAPNQKEKPFKWNAIDPKSTPSSKKEKVNEEKNIGVIYKGNFKNDGIHGEVKIYHPNGTCAFSGTINEGKKQSYCTGYHMNGGQAYEGYFADDQMHGSNNRIYDDEGIIIFEGEMVNGKKHGKGITYHGNGKLNYNGYFYNDVMHGDNIQMFFDNGKLEFEGNLVKGLVEGYGKSYNKHGELVYSGSYQNDKQSGTSCTQWQSYCDGSNLNTNDNYSWPLYSGNIQKGKRKGYGKIYHSSGKLCYRGLFKGEPYGNLLIIYNEDGSMKYIGGTKIAAINEY